MDSMNRKNDYSSKKYSYGRLTYRRAWKIVNLPFKHF